MFKDHSKVCIIHPKGFEVMGHIGNPHLVNATFGNHLQIQPPPVSS